MTHEYDRALEIHLLVIFGLFMLIFGLLLFEIGAGRLPYNLDSTYGLFLVLVSVQIITMGKTPFGDLRRSWALVLVGICAATLGMFACFIPGVLTEVVRVTVGLVLLGGGLSLILQLLLAEGKARTWLRAGPLMAELTVACALVYALSVIAGVITLVPGLAAATWTAIFLVIYGVSFLYLAWTLRRVAILYPLQEVRPKPAPDSIERFGLLKDAELPLSLAHLVLMATLLTFLGLLLFRVNLGLFPFSPDGQLGLLLTLMAIQVMALGDTPLGQLKRPFSMLAVGSIFATLGIVASIVPGLLTNWLRILLGALNIGSGTKSLIEFYLPTVRGNEGPPNAAPVSAIVKELTSTQKMLSGLSVAFGLTMLLPGLLPGFVMAGILIVNGLLLLKLASILRKLPAFQARAA